MQPQTVSRATREEAWLGTHLVKKTMTRREPEEEQNDGLNQNQACNTAPLTAARERPS